jgi:hypothetical protein
MVLGRNDFKKLIVKTYESIPNEVRSKLILCGSVNLLLQGVDVTPKKDIDLATDYDTVNFLIKYLKKDLVRYCSNFKGDDYLPFSYAFIKTDDFEIQFFDTIDSVKDYYYEVAKPENIINLKINDELAIKAFNLKSELIVLDKVGKIDKANAVRKFLKII